MKNFQLIEGLAFGILMWWFSEHLLIDRITHNEATSAFCRYTIYKKVQDYYYFKVNSEHKKANANNADILDIIQIYLITHMLNCKVYIADKYCDWTHV